MFIGRNVWQDNGVWLVFYSGQKLQFNSRKLANKFFNKARDEGAEYYLPKDDLSL